MQKKESCVLPFKKKCKITGGGGGGPTFSVGGGGGGAQNPEKKVWGVFEQTLDGVIIKELW